MSLLADLNSRYTHSAFRFEVLRLSPGYEPGVLRSVHNDPYLRRVAQHVLDGKQRDRVLLVDQPLTTVMTEHLDLYRANVAVGEGIAVSTAADLAERVGPDFWMFDELTDHAEVVVMHYGDDGQVEHREHLTDPPNIDEYRIRATSARRAAVDLGLFLVGSSSRGALRAG